MSILLFKLTAGPLLIALVIMLGVYFMKQMGEKRMSFSFW